MNHDFARYTDVSPDGKYIIMCGESYSYNFVSNWLEGYLLMINANDGTYVWGKYFQDIASNPTNYIGLIKVCKFVQSGGTTRILFAGQINFYKGAVGLINLDGTIQSIYNVASSNSLDTVGQTT